MEQERKKAMSAGTPGQDNNGHLTDADIEYFKKLLLDKRREIVGSVSEMQDEALNKSRTDASGDLSSMPIHMADMGSDTYEQGWRQQFLMICGNGHIEGRQ